MPEPQTGTSTVVATDGDTCIRLGIGSHSVGVGASACQVRLSRIHQRQVPGSSQAPVVSETVYSPSTGATTTP
jgi:hypothetical protein